jgi:hypothetical protein
MKTTLTPYQLAMKSLTMEDKYTITKHKGQEVKVFDKFDLAKKMIFWNKLMSNKKLKARYARRYDLNLKGI